MSDDIVQELKMDLEREKEKIFFSKYKYYIITIASVVLLSVIGYQVYQSQQSEKRQQAAEDYYKFTQYYNNIDTLTDDKLSVPELSKETVENFPNYRAMAQLVAFNNEQEQDVESAELLKITQDYIDDKAQKVLSVHDSLLKIFNLSLRANITNFKTIEPEFIAYLNHPFAFNIIAYETLFMLALNMNNQQQAQHYLKLLQENTAPEDANKIKIYKTHPLLVSDEKSKPETIPEAINEVAL